MMSAKIKIILLCMICALMACLCACSSEESGGKIQSPEKLSDFLYYMEIDRYTFEAMPKEPSPLFTVGCSSIRKGNLYGRNLDLSYCETPEFIVRVSATDGRFASIGICADLTASSNVDEMTEEQFLSMPNITNDGINENGVIVSVNIVDAAGVDDMTGTAPGKEKIHASRIVRYLLDRAESAEHAVKLMKDVDIVGGFSGYALHWMIADEQDTFVVEIIDGALAVSKNESYYLTNFYLNYGPVQKVQCVAETLFENIPLLNDYAIGVERWCILRDGYDGISSAEDMVRLLSSVKGTAMYDKTNAPAWYSECTGGELSIHSGKADYEEELARQIDLFATRSRSDPKGDWITWHTSIYDIEARTLCVYSQEDYSIDYQFALTQ